MKENKYWWGQKVIVTKSGHKDKVGELYDKGSIFYVIKVGDDNFVLAKEDEFRLV